MNQLPEKIEFSYTNWRAGFMRATLIGASIFGLLAVIAAVLGQPFSIYIVVYIGAYLALLILTILPVSYSIKAGTLLALTFGLGISGLLETGIWGDSRVFMLCAITLASLLFSWKTGWAFTGLSMLSYVISGWLILSKTMTISSSSVTPGDIGIWTSGSAGVFLFAVLIVNGIRLTQIEFEKAQERAQITLNLLRDERNTLEQRINERTSELQTRSQELAQRSDDLTRQSQDLEKANAYNTHRAAQFEAIAEISRSIADVKKISDLLPTIARVVSEKLGYYHTGIFLVDDARQYAVLTASNSAGGQRMLNRGHRLEIGKTGVVGRVADNGQAQIALDTDSDAAFLDNPDLPDTHSEMTLPLKTGNEVIGVLDVQSAEPNAFSQEDIAIFSTLSAQLSIAIQNARLFETTQKSLADAEALYRQFIQKEWSKVSQKQEVTGFRYNTLGIAPIEGVDSATIERVATQKVYIEKGKVASSLAVPITLRGEVIGILDMQSPGSRSWDQDEIDIAQAIADRVAIAAENARLFDETTSRAERERTVSEITSKIRSTNDPNEMIQIALNELKQVLKVKDARVVPYNPQKSNGES